jgi:FlaA1/EpsC-like NDP-sugar epimerase
LRPALQGLCGNIYTEAVISAADPASRTAILDWFAFLARPRLSSPSAESLEQLRDASIVVTGAGGSIGSALSLALAALRPRELVLLDASEQALHRLQSAIAAVPLPARPSFYLANVSDEAHLNEIFEIHRPRLIFHAAAYKHLPLLEEHPLQAIANNALGTLALTRSVFKVGARIVLLSTDKAVAPTSILGATKRIAEQIVLAHAGVAVRLGNVLGSEGSVSHTFLRQIAASSPITITSPDARRYFLTCEEAVDLLLHAAAQAEPGSLLLPTLARQHSIVSLAKFLIARSTPPTKSQIVFTGLRPGEKPCEALWSSDEQPQLEDRHGFLTIQPQPSSSSLLHRELTRLEKAVADRDLPRALAIVLEIVPGYTPSATLLTQIQKTVPGALHP